MQMMEGLTFRCSYSVATVENFWSQHLGRMKPLKYLEIGSFEGFSACRFLSLASDYLDAQLTSPLEMVCVDSWGGGEEHRDQNFAEIEATFDTNVSKALQAFGQGRPGAPPTVRKMKALSHPALQSLLPGMAGHFDLIYVDGSHRADDTLADIVLSFFLLKCHGTMIIDDYLWKQPQGLGAIHQPKIDIDAFTTIFEEKLQIIGDVPLRQLAFVKTQA